MRSGPPKLSEAAHRLVLPSAITSTEWPAVRDKLRLLGIGFDLWQEGLAKAALAKRSDGQYASGVGGVVMSIPRQVGKTYTVGAIAFALCLLHPRLKIIWTAHHSNTADETFEAMSEMAGRGKVAPHVRAVRQGSGKQSIHFKNRSRIEFGAREHGFGRGKQKVGLLVLDEAQILSERAMENLVPTTNQAENPLIFLMGTPPRAGVDNGEVFRSRRAEALAGESDDMLYVEFSTRRPVDVSKWTPGQVGDWDAVAEANPSFPARTPKAAILRMRKLLPSPDSFRYEALGIWDETGGGGAVTAARWGELQVPEAPEGVRSYAVAFSFDDSRVAVAGARKPVAGPIHVELIDAVASSRDAGVAQLVWWFCEDPSNPERWRSAAQIALCGRSGATVLYQALREAGVPARVLRLVTTEEYTTACAMTLDAVRDGSLSHLAGQAPLDASVTTAEKKARGTSGAWGWVVPGGDETPVEAVSVVLWAARTSKRKPGRRATVSF